MSGIMLNVVSSGGAAAGKKAIFGYGAGQLSMTNIVSDVGVVVEVT